MCCRAACSKLRSALFLLAASLRFLVSLVW